MEKVNELENLDKKTESELQAQKNDIKSESNKEKVRSKFKGFLYVLCAATFGSFQHFFMLKAKFFNGIEQTTIRYFFQLVTMFIIAKCYKVSLKGPKEQRKTLIIRGVMGAIGLLFFNISIKLINPSDSVALFSTNIIIVSVLARFFFKEKFTIAHILALIAMFFGIGLISQPSFLISKSNSNSNITYPLYNKSNISTNTSLFVSQNLSPTIKYILGVVCALTAAFFASAVVIALKKLTNKKVHHTVIIFFAAYIGLPMSAPIALILLLSGYATKDPNELKNYNYITIQTIYASISALMGCCFQVTINLAYKYDDASKISIYRTLDLIFTFLMQYFFLNIKSNQYNIIGSVLIVFGNILVLGLKLLDTNSTETKQHDNSTDETLDNTKKKSSFRQIIFKKF